MMDDNYDSWSAIRAMAQDDFDAYDDRLPFDEAVERRGPDGDVRRAIDELGEDEAAEIYDDAYTDVASNWFGEVEDPEDV